MAAITYPSSLPAPQRWGAVPRERRGVSPLPGNTQLRNRWRDQVQDVDAQWLYKPDEMESWEAWFRETLVLGQRWFGVNVPGPGGWVDRVARYRTGSVRKEWLGLGIWRVTAKLEQRGEGVIPTVAEPPEPPAPPAFVSSSGVGQTPTLPPGVQAGNGILLLIMHTGLATTVTFDEAWADDSVATEQDSSSSLRLRSYVRVADGTEADEAMGFSLSAFDESTWCVLAFRGMNDGNFPFTMSAGSDYAVNMEAGDGINPNPISKGAPNWTYVACAFGLSTTANDEHITADPAGYTNVANREYPRGGSSTAHLRVATRTVTTTVENPGGFAVSFGFPSGALGIGIAHDVPTGDATDEEPIDETPPDPAPPDSGDYSTPRVMGLDYTPDYSDANAAMLAPLPLVLRGMSTGSATTHGIAYVNKLQAINPTVQVAQYLRYNELAYPVAPGSDYYPLFLECVANGWYVRSQPGNLLVQWTDEYANYELNVTDAVPVNGDGQRLAQFKAAEFDFPYRLDKMPEVNWVFVDNFRRQPLVDEADYNCDGINEPAAYVGPSWRDGYSAYVDALKTLRPGLKVIGNVNHSVADSECSGVLDAGFDEGTIGKSWGRFTVYGITGAADGKSVRERMLALQANCGGMAIMSAFGTATNYQRMRFGLTMAMLFDAWFSYIVEGGTLRTVWADEYGQEIGIRTGTIPAAAWQNGVWMQEFSNGVVLCNPTTTARTVDTSSLGSLTRFSGAQVPSVNSGAPVTGPITIASQDGILLLFT